MEFTSPSFLSILKRIWVNSFLVWLNLDPYSWGKPSLWHYWEGTKALIKKCVGVASGPHRCGLGTDRPQVGGSDPAIRMCSHMVRLQISIFQWELVWPAETDWFHESVGLCRSDPSTAASDRMHHNVSVRPQQKSCQVRSEQHHKQALSIFLKTRNPVICTLKAISGNLSSDV